MSETPLRILIVGGGIAGLTLANALEHAPVPIDYLVLEARDALAPQLGAGIALAPNGSRILDQLGAYADLEAQLVPVSSSGVLDARGRPLLPERSDAASLVGARMSYPLGWVERREVVRALVRRSRRRGCLLTGKKACAVEQRGDQVVVECTDGSSFTGDVVVGADGAHSTTRREMWRAVEKSAVDTDAGFDVARERRAMTAEYKCLFAISRPIRGLDPGSSEDTLAPGVSAVVAAGHGGRIFWFLFGRMERVFSAHEIPRFGPTDAANFASQHADLPVRSGGCIRVADLWDARETATLVALEEADFARWTAGRFACLGDSVHKMTPHTGAGGMLAIESAAALANALVRLASAAAAPGPPISDPLRRPAPDPPLPTTTRVAAALRTYEERMRARASAKIRATADAARFHALRRGLRDSLLARLLVPRAGDLRADQFCDNAVGAERIDFVPLPPRSMAGLMPFNPAHGIARHEEPRRRVFRALPLLAAGAGAAAIWAVAPVVLFREVLARGVYGDVVLRERFYGVPWLDGWARAGALRFVVSEAHFFWQPLCLFADYGVWYAIMLIESARRAQQLTVLRFAVLWGILNMAGIGVFAPVYYFAHYVVTPISRFDAADMRLTDLSYTASVLPVLAACHYGTVASAYLAPDHGRRQAAGFLWELMPIWVCAAQYLLARHVLPPSTLRLDRLANVKRDLPVIRVTMLVLCAVSTAVWQCSLWLSHQPLKASFVPVMLLEDGLGFERAYSEFLKWDHVFFAVPSVVWVALLMRDLKKAGMVRVRWLALALAAVVIIFVGGNGTMLGLVWLYREEILARRRHKAAVLADGN